MNIYATHSTGFDFRSELYAPLKTLPSDKYNFIFPHEDDSFTDSKDIIRTCDLVLAEVSYPSTGQGIELGWADARGVPVVCMYKSDAKISGSLGTVCSTFVKYASPEEMAEKLKAILDSKATT